MTASSSPPAIELIGVDKSFGPVHANKNVNLRVERGVIHGIVGENGAGKSTLMSILYGFYEADAGEIRVNGEPVRIRSSKEAIGHGIGMVHQHFMLVPPLSVLENVMLGAEGGPLLASGAAAIRAEARASRQGIRARGRSRRDRRRIVGRLAAARRNPEGAGARRGNPRARRADRGADARRRPISSSTMLRVLKSQNKTIIFITHKLREIMALTDRVSVMRRGEMVATFETSQTSPPELADAMVGRKVILKIEKGPRIPARSCSRRAA